MVYTGCFEVNEHVYLVVSQFPRLQLCGRDTCQ